MKRPPQAGEPALIHSTEQTGDVQRFAICAQNYNPQVVQQMERLIAEPVLGFRIKLLAFTPDEQGVEMEFVVARESGEVLTRNTVWREANSVHLHTSVLAVMSPDEAYMLADLEQCAALGGLETLEEEVCE